MTLLVVGVSHRLVPIELLDRIALVPDEADSLAADLVAGDSIAEAMVLATCNRIELYLDVARFHPAVAAASDLLAKWSGVPMAELSDHIHVHFDTSAVAHLFEVACGLDSMVVGEAQILGQLRAALLRAQELGTAGRELNGVVQHALRAGKRVQTETGIDRAGASVVSVAIDAASVALGDRPPQRAVVVGAGSMGSLALSVLADRGVPRICLASRDRQRAGRVAAGTGAGVLNPEDVDAELAHADLAIYATGAVGTLLTTHGLRLARGTRGDPLVVLDLALPHDVDPGISALPGVTRLDLAAVSDHPGASASRADIDAAREIVAEEVEARAAAVAGQQVAPVLVSLRAHLNEVLDAEVHRLRLRLRGLEDRELAEVERAMRRALATLLHNPTVRMKRLAAEPGGDRYAEAITALFDLDPDIPASLSAGRSPASDGSGPGARS